MASLNRGNVQSLVFKPYQYPISRHMPWRIASKCGGRAFIAERLDSIARGPLDPSSRQPLLNLSVTWNGLRQLGAFDAIGGDAAANDAFYIFNEAPDPESLRVAGDSAPDNWWNKRFAGAHVRVANARDEPLNALNQRMFPGGFPRLLRRGTPYGPPLDGLVDDGIDRGIVGMFLCANLNRQFYTITRWLGRTDFSPLLVDPDGQDPIVGDIGFPGLARIYMRTTVRPFRAIDADRCLCPDERGCVSAASQPRDAQAAVVAIERDRSSRDRPHGRMPSTGTADQPNTKKPTRSVLMHRADGL